MSLKVNSLLEDTGEVAKALELLKRITSFKILKKDNKQLWGKESCTQKSKVFMASIPNIHRDLLTIRAAQHFDDDETVNAMALALLLDFADIAQAPEVECDIEHVQLKAEFTNASYRAFSDGAWTQSHAVRGLGSQEERAGQ